MDNEAVKGKGATTESRVSNTGVGRHRRQKGKRRNHGKERKVFKKRVPKWKAEVQAIESVTSQYMSLDSDSITNFQDIPMSSHTQEGLMKANYTVPTEIQREAIPLALKGRDILGAAKTGSGKTLAFLVPLLELLWRERWASLDGLGALVISPTRELAYQTFEVLRRIGSFHDFSAGLVIGGKNVEEEQRRILTTNIVICTPGRLLHHMDQTPNFECSSLKLLVLDEADRILDLGFRETMNAIVDNLPAQRQTLLFSATQTKSVRDLARLSLKDPEYVAVHEHSTSSTPHQLIQTFVVCELPDKLNILYSFLRNHLHSKTIVFISSCKQVKFIYEVFRRLRPGIPLMALYGRQKQERRVGIYSDFCRKTAAVLFCTDIAARGLDFPAVHWVVQLDCPEDAHTYIHRVGRTARYEKEGKALLFLLPSEKQGMLECLELKKIPIKEISVNPKKTTSIQKKLEAFCVQDQDMKHWAQRSFICYLRSIHLQSNKKVFDVHQLPMDEYAKSLGLSQPPRVRFLQRVKHKIADKDEDSSGDGEGQDDGWGSNASGSESGGEDEELLKVRRVIMPDNSILEGEVQQEKVDREGRQKLSMSQKKHASKVTAAKKLLHKGIQLSQHVRFDEDGMPAVEVSTVAEQKGESSDSDEDAAAVSPIPISQLDKANTEQIGGIDISEAMQRMKSRDQLDRKREQERIRSLHRERRAKQRKFDDQETSKDVRGAVLAAGGDQPEVAEDLSGGERSEESSDEEIAPPSRKRLKRVTKEKSSKAIKAVSKNSLETELFEDEELALHLLTSNH